MLLSGSCAGCATALASVTCRQERHGEGTPLCLSPNRRHASIYQGSMCRSSLPNTAPSQGKWPRAGPGARNLSLFFIKASQSGHDVSLLGFYGTSWGNSGFTTPCFSVQPTSDPFPLIVLWTSVVIQRDRMENPKGLEEF